MLEAIGTSLTAVFSWFGQFFSALTTPEGSLYAMLPLVGVGLAISLVGFSFKLIKRILWGA